MGRCSALTRADPTRRPQALGRLRLIFGLPAHLHVRCSIWAFVIHPKQNHKSGAANALRLPRSSTQPQSSEVIDCMPQPYTWHDAWELSLNLSQHPYLLSPLRFPLNLFPFLPSVVQLSECQGSDILAPHHPSTSWSCSSVRGNIWYLYHSHILLVFESLMIPSTNAAPAFPHSTNHQRLLHLGISNDSVTWCVSITAALPSGAIR